jgi:hypothetical protein
MDTSHPTHLSGHNNNILTDIPIKDISSVIQHNLEIKTYFEPIITKYKNQLELIQDDVAWLKIENIELKEDNVKKDIIIDELRADIVELKADNKKKDIIIDELKAEIGELKSEIVELKATNKRYEESKQYYKFMTCFQDLNDKFKLERTELSTTFINLRNKRVEYSHYLDSSANETIISQYISALYNKILTMDLSVKKRIDKNFPKVLEVIIYTIKSINVSITDEVAEEIDWWWNSY